MPIERLHSGQDLPIVAAVDQHLGGRRILAGNLKVPFELGPHLNTGTTQLHTAFEREGIVCWTSIERYRAAGMTALGLRLPENQTILVF